uniref:Uncharacterized protein n=1 Tax=Polytomella parva TaxID=51329 RepID=A0A7S0UU72_9CHLO|mmetsp:Transcript_17960/g.32797  ORF Transcript_17960/g.32797 Transcript_17960/m.32797 type:complete len:240 (+) Transcript_17960:106-825(+)
MLLSSRVVSNDNFRHKNTTRFLYNKQLKAKNERSSCNLESSKHVLKEWSVVIGALLSGEQNILFRKGGIKEPVFKPIAKKFLLFPTSFHSEQKLLKSHVEASYPQELKFDPKAVDIIPVEAYAEVTGAWTTTDPSVVESLSSYHITTNAVLESRLKWKKKQPITILELRIFRLNKPISIPRQDSLFGCFSWVDLEDGITLTSKEISWAGTPVIDDATFEKKQKDLRKRLLTSQATEIVF